MRVIFCKWNSICEKGVSAAFDRLGIGCIDFVRSFTSVDYDMDYISDLVDRVLEEKKNDSNIFLFTINFQPIVARAAKVLKLPYLSWTVDCPSFQLYSETTKYATSHIFVLDRMQAEKYASLGVPNIYHLPMACDLDSWDRVVVSGEDHKKYDADISFVGSLYSEKCIYNSIEKDLPEYMRGYVDGLIDAQLNVYGYNFLEDSITKEFADEFKKYADWIPLGSDYYEDTRAIVADTYVGYKCTEKERIKTLQAISENYNMDLWTLSDTTMIPKINNRGGADSNTMMPKIIKCSKINLNMTNRPIKTGMPLRIFDLMGAGGFVISNYQVEILDHFVPGQDIVLYESIPDLIDKIGYYLEHDDERIEIARKGYEKVREYHTYDIRIVQMLQAVGIL